MVFSSINPDPVEAWLQTATRGLWDKAQQRIRAEVLSHLSEAIQSRIEDGQPEAQAQRDALAALGDPNKARRAFRRVHLTASEAGYLKGTLGSNQNSRKFIFLLSLFAGICGTIAFIMTTVAFYMTLTLPGKESNMNLFASLGICLMGWGWAIQSLRLFSGSIRLRLMFFELGILVVIMSSPLLTYSLTARMISFTHQYWPYGVGFAPGIFCIICYALHFIFFLCPLWRKLHDHVDFEQIRDDLITG